MTSKQKSFKNQFRQELDNVKLNVKRIDSTIIFKTQNEITEAKMELQRIDKRLEELNPAWCEVWRLKRRKEKAERKLKHFSSF